MDLSNQPYEELDASMENSLTITDKQSKFDVVARSYRYNSKPICWDNLPDALQSVMPTDEMYTYIVEEFNELPKEEYPDLRFTATIRINLNNDEEAKEWIGKMCDHSKCTYRVTRTYKPSLKRILWRTDMHCQHQRKPLSIKQSAAKAVCKKNPNPLMEDVQQKKTGCPSSLVLKIKNPTKKELHSQQANFCSSHKGHLQFNFTHNHFLHSAHTLGFRPISAETKERYVVKLFFGRSQCSKCPPLL